jgi:hypothetical protein
MRNTFLFLVLVVVAAQSAYAKDFTIGPPPGTGELAKAAGVKPPPSVTVTPPTSDTAPSAKVEAPGVGTVVLHGDPGKPVPDVHIDAHGAIADGLNKANDTIQDGQKKVEEAAKTAVEFPLTAAEAALKIVGDTAKKAIEDIVTAAKAALQTQIDDLWAKYKWKVYLAGGAFFAILMSPALIAAWLVRRIGRKRERKMDAALNEAMKVIRAYAKEAGVKVSA